GGGRVCVQSGARSSPAGSGTRPGAPEATAADGASASGRPGGWAGWSGTSPLETSMVSHPKLFACARRSGFRSPTMTAAAPRNCAEAAQARPTGPPPATYTVEPEVTPAVTAP